MSRLVGVESQDFAMRIRCCRCHEEAGSGFLEKEIGVKPEVWMPLGEAEVIAGFVGPCKRAAAMLLINK